VTDDRGRIGDFGGAQLYGDDVGSVGSESATEHKKTSPDQFRV